MANASDELRCITTPVELEAAMTAAGSQPLVLGCFASAALAQDTLSDLALLAPGIVFAYMALPRAGGSAGTAPAAMFSRLGNLDGIHSGGVALLFVRGEIVHRGPANLNLFLPVLAEQYCRCLRALGTPAALKVSQTPGERLLTAIETPENFEAVAASEPLAVVDFTASWCGPCKRLKPAYEALARLVPGVAFATADVDVAEEVRGMFQVGPIPALLVLRKGKQAAPLDLGADIANVVHTLAGAHRRVYAARGK